MSCYKISVSLGLILANRVSHTILKQKFTMLTQLKYLCKCNRLGERKTSFVGSELF